MKYIFLTIVYKLESIYLIKNDETDYLYSFHKGEFEEEQDIFVQFESLPMENGTYLDCYKI